MITPVTVVDRTEPQHDPSARLARLVDVRDERCSGPGCSAPAGLTDRDHNQPWPAGPTAAWNLIVRSRRCHRAKHTGWKPEQHPDGSTTWISPLGRSYLRPSPHQPPAALPDHAELPPPRDQPPRVVTDPERDDDGTWFKPEFHGFGRLIAAWARAPMISPCSFSSVLPADGRYLDHMLDLDLLVAAYWEHNRLSQGKREDRLRSRDIAWAYAAVIDAMTEGADGALDMIKALLAAPDANACAVGAGPIEELLVHHGTRLDYDVAVRCRQSASWRKALACV